MKRMLFLGALLVACAAPSAPVAPTVPAGSVPAPRELESAGGASASDYPPTYPVLAESELERRTAEAVATTPGWSITLDPLGFLSTATCDACSSGSTITPQDHAVVETFLSKQGALVGVVGGPSVTKKYDNPTGMLIQQSGSSGPCGNVFVSKRPSKLTVSGHLWPRVPSGEMKPEEALEHALKARDGSPDLLVQRGYRTTAPSLRGPLEHREVACLYSAVDDLTRAKGEKAPKRPCVDAHTGEDVTERLVGTNVSTTNGKVTERKLTQ